MDGDCHSGSNYSTGTNNHSTENKQSPVNETAAKAYKVYNQGLGGQQIQQTHQISFRTKIITIYKQRDLMFEVSDDLSMLIQYSPLNKGSNQYNYKRVTNPTRIREIERRGHKWIVLNVDLSYEYFVLRQVVNYNRYSGIVKIVKMTNATVQQWALTRIKANPEDWIYYEKG